VSKPETIAAEAAAPITEEQVVDYLRSNPHFLESQPDLMTLLTPPAYRQERRVVDFQQYMIKRLQDEVGELRGTHDELVESLRNARSFQGQIHSAVLDILNARSFEYFVDSVATDLGVHLGLDAVALCMETDQSAPPRTRVGIRFLPVGYVDRIMDGEDLRVRTLIRAERKIYGGAASLVASDALLRLSVSSATPDALLALGSRDEGFFQPGHGTDLLAFLGHAIESTARAWLDLPA
jgi:uncharacterized protein YigA (DUF484 family)